MMSFVKFKLNDIFHMQHMLHSNFLMKLFFKVAYLVMQYKYSTLLELSRTNELKAHCQNLRIVSKDITRKVHCKIFILELTTTLPKYSSQYPSVTMRLCMLVFVYFVYHNIFSDFCMKSST